MHIYMRWSFHMFWAKTFFFLLRRLLAVISTFHFIIQYIRFALNFFVFLSYQSLISAHMQAHVNEIYMCFCCFAAILCSELLLSYLLHRHLDAKLLLKTGY